VILVAHLAFSSTERQETLDQRPGQKRMYTDKTSVFDLEVLFIRPQGICLTVE
jgi:hypothetical protein